MSLVKTPRGKLSLLVSSVFSILLFFQLSLPAFAALSNVQSRAFVGGIKYVNTEDDACGPGAGGAASGGVPGANSGVWNSGLQPPYILEQFAIETLKDIAAKKGVPETSTVTQEHVTALVAFMFGEGGDIMNGDLFNPLNTGLDAPELVDGGHAGDGLQSFKSFDAGVEATARTMVGDTQSRLGDAVVLPTSTAQDFMSALSYWFKYPGNAPWAEASRGNEDNYFATRMELVGQVRAHYDTMAGIQLGTPEHEQALNMIHPELLKFDGGGGAGAGSSSSSSSSSCASTGQAGATAQGIAQTALKYAWEDGSHGLKPKDEYAAAITQYNPGAPFSGADCGAFVATVMVATGADPDYPLVGTLNQENYVRKHPEKYDIVDSVASTADLQPGDILIVNDKSGGPSIASGHTVIYVGPQPITGFNEASASGGERMANLGNAVLADSRGNYMRVRLK